MKTPVEGKIECNAADGFPVAFEAGDLQEYLLPLRYSSRMLPLLRNTDPFGNQLFGCRVVFVSDSLSTNPCRTSTIAMFCLARVSASASCQVSW